MKTISFFFITFLFCFAAVAQKSDSTKLRFGKKIIVITDDSAKKGSRGAFKKNLLECKQNILSYNDSIDAVKKELKNTSLSETEREAKEQKLLRYEKQIEEQEKKIEALSEGIEDMDDDDDDDFSFDRDFDCKFLSKNKIHRFRGHWAGLTLGINNFGSKNFKLELPQEAENMELSTWKSWDFSINFVQFSFNLAAQRLGIVTGGGFQWNNYRFSKDIQLLEDAGGKIIPTIDNYTNFKKNELTTCHFNIPFLLEYQMPIGRRKFFVSGGVIGGVRLYTQAEQTIENDDTTNEIEIDNDFQTDIFRYGVTFRIGYGILKLHATYQMTSLFKKDKGPEIYPFSVGLTLLSF